MTLDLHPITAESFAIIDREIGAHSYSPPEYEIVRRIIHSTADFEFKNLVEFRHHAIASGIHAIQNNTPVIVDVRMVKMGVAGTLQRAEQPEPLCALDYRGEGETLTAAGMRTVARQHPGGIFVVGNAPTALQALAAEIRAGNLNPALVVGVPVGFVAVEEAKQEIARLKVPQITVKGRKGGSPVAAAIANALVYLAVNGVAT